MSRAFLSRKLYVYAVFFNLFFQLMRRVCYVSESEQNPAAEHGGLTCILVHPRERQCWIYAQPDAEHKEFSNSALNYLGALRDLTA